MTYSRPNARYNHVNQNGNNSAGNSPIKKTRGPINKRACQRCRQGKIKCDGDAETGKSCSNCDPSHCKFDNSPRKNKQVESLKLRLNAVEEQLVAITSDVSEQLQTKDIEKEIICLLYESKEHFLGYETLFDGLRDALKQSRCMRQTLPITFELLKRLQEVKNIPEIMKSLQRFVDCANSDISILTSGFPSTDMFKKMDDYNMGQTYPLPVDSVIMPLQLNNTEVDNIGGHHLEDDGESPGNFDFNNNGSTSPTTPPQPPSQEVNSESKCFGNPQNLATTTATPYFYDSPQYYYNQYNVNVMDSNYTMNFGPPTTTSPTDEPIASWNPLSN